MKTNFVKLNKKSNQNSKYSRGQGMIEYILVLAVVIVVTVSAMGTISASTSTLVNNLVTNIQAQTGVPAPSAAPSN